MWIRGYTFIPQAYWPFLANSLALGIDIILSFLAKEKEFKGRILKSPVAGNFSHISSVINL